MPAVLAPALSAVQIARGLTSPRKVLLIRSHTGTLTGNALGLALAAQASPDFLPVFLGERDIPLGLEIPTWKPKSRMARMLLRRGDVLANTGFAHSKSGLGAFRRLRLFLWHGMPIKGIGKYDPLFKADRASEPCDLAIATSGRMMEVISESFDIPPEKFVISGEPKTDELPTDRPGWNWSASLRPHYRSIVGYFPTWREKIVETGARPRRRSDDAALGLLLTQLTGDAALRQLLERHQTAFVIRMHALNAGAAPSLSPPFFAMGDAQGEATHLLQECDAVVSDYSSVAIDALLFGRPLALWCEDLDRYAAERPLPYFDFRDIFGWALKPTLAQLREWLADRIESRPLSASVQDGFARARRLFHQHPRGGAGERVLEALRERLARSRSE
jgi:CDP-Glycerol:Poly(glycerophosphate) glycerophosphotransferase